MGAQSDQITTRIFDVFELIFPPDFLEKKLAGEDPLDPLAVISRNTPEYQCLWFQFYWASNFYCMAIAADSLPPTGSPSAADWVAAGVAAASETSVTAATDVASAPVATVVAAADSIITRGIRCAGVEEVAAIPLMQRALLSRRAIAKLLVLPGGKAVSWETEDFGDDPGRREWHERKIESKCARARRQLDLLGLSNGVVMHRSRRGRGGGGERKRGDTP